MENFKINLWSFFSKVKACLCMIFLNGTLFIILYTMFALLMHFLGMSHTLLIIFFCIGLPLFWFIQYKRMCKNCIQPKFKNICEECKARKLAVCEAAIKRNKKIVYQTASERVEQLENEKEKWQKVKRNKSLKDAITDFDKELAKWLQIKDKNSDYKN